MMTGFDYVVLAIMGFSTLLSMMRGLSQEILSLLSWLGALWCASQYADPLSTMLPLEAVKPEFSILLAFIGILFTVWLASLFIRQGISRFINMAGLSGIDRILGTVFGFVRGGVVVLILVLAAGLTKFPQLPIWYNAMFSGVLVSVALETLPWLPPALRDKLQYGVFKQDQLG